MKKGLRVKKAKKSKELRKLEKRYEKVCEKLEQLNDEAFMLEQDMLFQEKDDEKKK